MTLTLEDDNSGQFYWRHSQGKEQILEYVFLKILAKYIIYFLVIFF